jgi:hypothetical protein
VSLGGSGRSLPGVGISSETGAASVEHAALAAMIAIVVIAALAALRHSPPERATRELGEVIGRRIACAPRHPVPCGRNPLALAYGFPLGKLVRYLAPRELEAAGPGGALLPVDFRRCRLASCAAPGAREGLTASMRRVTLFTAVRDLRRSGAGVTISYWLYRPGQRWERIVRVATTEQIAAASSIRLNLEDDPVLVPFETLPGRDHYRFPPGEEPPWRWSIASRPSGRPFG